MGHRQRLRQAQGEDGAFARFRGDVQRTAKLTHFTGDHVHADAATGKATHRFRSGEARLEDQHIEVGITKHGVRFDQAALDRSRTNRCAIDATTIVADLQHYFRTFTPHRDADAAFIDLAGLTAGIRRLQAMRHCIAQHVFQRRGHALQHVAIEFALRAL